MPVRKEYDKEKQCTSCLEIKQLSDFWKSARKRKDGTQAYRHECKKCQSSKTTVYIRNANLKKYGITEEIYEKERKKQNFSCLICNKHEETEFLGKLNIDHDHKTGKYRGLLCTNCNHGLGKFLDDSKLLQKAIEYLNARSS